MRWKFVLMCMYFNKIIIYKKYIYFQVQNIDLSNKPTNNNKKMKLQLQVNDLSIKVISAYFLP